jgi:GMP synthase-like glutamine amidotransferase
MSHDDTVVELPPGFETIATFIEEKTVEKKPTKKQEDNT